MYFLQNTNGSQFFITFDKTPWLDGNHTVFGQISEGNEVLDLLEQYGSQTGRPLGKIEIVDCGEIKDQWRKRLAKWIDRCLNAFNEKLYKFV